MENSTYYHTHVDQINAMTSTATEMDGFYYLVLLPLFDPFNLWSLLFITPF